MAITRRSSSGRVEPVPSRAEELTVGILREGGGLAAEVLHDLGINVADLRRRLLARVPHAA
ncbi:Clp protease N-terminal domain-containing protein [Dactylosporangium sp. NPDC000244]|uniref:Clp protease N-terminal domain-containing protein n=1 Tax=Dactylosporangium sp. NPDC000244 TaxID=3154365 RepID=UPI00331EF9BC